MAKWSLKSYNRFIKQLRKERGISVAQARLVYRQMSGELKRPLFVSDLKKFSRRTNRAVIQIEEEGGSARYIQDVLAQTKLYKYHYDPDFKFEHVKGTQIIKVSINTTKTRKKFNIRVR